MRSVRSGTTRKAKRARAREEHFLFTPLPALRGPNCKGSPQWCPAGVSPVAGARRSALNLTIEKRIMSTTNLRQAAVQAILTTKYQLQQVNFKDQHIKHLFG